MKVVAEKSAYHRFALYYEYDPEKVAFCRSLKDGFGWQRFGFAADGKLKRWVFSESLFVPVLAERFPELQIDPEVERVVKHEQEWTKQEKKREEKIDIIKRKEDTDFRVKGLKKELYPYQRVGVEFLVESGGRAINASEMGTGKTAMTLAYIKHQKFQRSLIVAPASVKFSWKNEIQKWTNLSSIVIDSTTDIASIDADINIWVINYDILKKHFGQLGKIRFDCIVGDEAQLIKNPQAIRTKAFRQLSSNIGSVILLSGTPLLSRPAELYSLLNIIDPKTWNHWHDYARRYCKLTRTPWGWDSSGATNIDELHARIQKYFIRFKKDDILKELPPKIFTEIPIQLPGDIAKEYNSAEKDLAMHLRLYSGKQPAQIAKTMQAEKLAKLNILRLLVAKGNAESAKEIIENIIETGEKILVFSSFVEPLENLKTYFGNQAVMITGKTDIKEREAIVKAFQEDKKVKIFLGGYKSAGTGITLTAASNFLGIDDPWNPADRSQSIDRLHRPGTTATSVNIYRLHAIGTVAEDMKETLEKKQGIFDRVIDGKSEEIVNDIIEVTTKRLLQKY